MNLANQIAGNAMYLSPGYTQRYGANTSPVTQQLANAAQGKAPSWYSWVVDVAFVVGGFALIVASVYTAMHSTTVFTQASSGVKGLLTT